MNRKFSSMLVVTLLAAGSAQADFSYEQTSKMTGGTMAAVMKMAGAFSKQAREPMRSTITVKGDRMAMISAHRINIIDLAAETMTDVDLEKKTYAVITFAEFGQAMQKMSEKMGQKSNADVKFKADLKQTGATRVINGLEAKESILSLIVEGQDQKTGDKGAMNVITNMWLAPNLPGYEEVKGFYSRMAQKLAFAPGMGGLGAMMGQQAGMAKGMSELAKEASKLDGVPVLQVVRIGGTVNGMSDVGASPSSASSSQSTQQPQAATPTASGVAGSAATSAASSRMGRFGGVASGIGGLGGLGRKKKEQEQSAAASPADQGPAQTAPSATEPAAAGILMELTTELTGFSSAAVDMSRLSVPPGFRLVEHDMSKAAK